jgi:hypothetical protein
MFNKILFLKRKNDFFSKKIISELKKKVDLLGLLRQIEGI